MRTALEIGAVFVLVFANALFVASEFAIVAARRARVDALADRGHRAARIVQRALADPDRFIAATQLGITMASLGLGWIGEPAIAGRVEVLLGGVPLAIRPVAAHSVAVTIAFILITALHIVLGELAPKSVALWHPEQTAMAVVPPTVLFDRVFRPFIALLNGAAALALRAVGLRAPSVGRHVYTEEDIRRLVTESRKAGELEREEEALVHRVFQFTERVAWQVMVPRVKIIGVAHTATAAEAAALIQAHGYTRLPVYHDDLDHIVGMIHAKDLLIAALQGRGAEPASGLMRPVLVTIETKDVADLLEEMRGRGRALAVVLDEYGGTAGIITLEDLLEEIVGEIPGELRPPHRLVRARSEDRLVVDGAIPLGDLDDLLGVAFPAEEVETLGGFVFERCGAVPRVGDGFDYEGWRFRVESMEGARVGLVEITRLADGTARRPQDGGQSASS